MDKYLSKTFKKIWKQTIKSLILQHDIVDIS